MPSLAKIFSFAAVAFAAFASAAPAAAPPTDVAKISDVNTLATRGCACAEPNVPSLVGILVDLKAKVDVDVKALAAITKDTCTYDNIKPIVVNIVAKVDAAVEAIVILGKYKKDQILFDGNVVVGVKVIADLLVSIIVSICAALEVCLRLIVALDVKVKADIHALLCLVGVVIARLIHVVCGLLVGLTAELVAILCIKLKVCFWVFVQLKLVDLYALLKINVTAFVGISL